MTKIPIALPSGTVEVSADLLAPARAWHALGLAPGAGAGRDHPFLQGFAEALHDAGVATLAFDFPYREAGRRMPGPAAHAVATWEAATAHLRAELPGIPVTAAGKSYGGRMASLAAAEKRIEVSSLVYLGYPLHAPGKPEKPRGDHLRDITVPQLFLAGTRDPFLDPHAQFRDVVATCPVADIVWIEGGGHSFEVAGKRRAPEEIGAELAGIVVPWLTQPRT